MAPVPRRGAPSPDGSTPPQGGVAIYLLATLLLLISLGATFVVVSHRASHHAEEESAKLTQAIASGVADQITRALQSIDVLLLSVSGRYRFVPDSPFTPELAALSVEMPQMRALLMVDDGGRVIAANVPDLIGRPMDRHIDLAALRRSPNALWLGRPVPGRWMDEDAAGAPGTGIWSLPLARAVRGSDGRMAGAVVGILNPEYLAGIAQRPAEAFDALVRVHTFDGVLIARSDGYVGGVGERRPDGWMFQGRLPERETASFTGVDQEGAEVTASLAVTRNVPLVVEAVRPEHAVQASARDQDRILIAASTFVALVTLIAMLLLLRERQRLAVKAQEARIATRAKDGFIAAMSHEIRTPMNGVLGTADLLLDTRLSPLQRRYADTMRRSAAHLMTVLNDILDFSKLDANSVEPEEALFSVEDEVATIADLFAATAWEKGVELICALAPAMPPRVLGDAPRFRQILFNLLGNAVKFTEAGWIRLAVSVDRATDGSAALLATVSDTGIGFDPAKLPSLFEPFTQEDASISRRYGGTGLGLAISRRLAAALGGEIEAEPRPGGGSVFRVRIAVGLPPGGSPVPAPAFAGKRILVVGRPGPTRDALQQDLVRLGVLRADSADRREAKAVLALGGFDAVLVDDHPGTGDETGIAVAEDLRAAAEDPVPRFVFATGGDLRLQARRGLFDAVLLKPALPARLAEAMAHAFDLKPRPAPAEPKQPAVEPGPPLRILIVEDNPVNQFVLRKMLERAGVEVDVAPDGAEALAAAATRLYDTILMDVQMPRMDGLEATRRLRAEPGPNRATRIIGLTAAVGAEFERSCLRAGMDEYLTKPVLRATLLDALNLAA